VRAIFTLPACYQPHLTETHFVYIELFKLFSCDLPKRQPCLLKVSPQYYCGTSERKSAVIPITDLVLSCHLVPIFQKLSEDLWKDGMKKDLVDAASAFYLNEFSSHLMYAYMRNWKTML
jgi:hypothetical protein